ncbi:MAG: hypothetical protein AAGJ70_00595 [Pseudomonadota bacterium]
MTRFSFPVARVANTTAASLAGVAIAAMLTASPASAHQPGAVNCHAADTRTEHAICASKRLRRVDDRMNQMFSNARAAAYDRYDIRLLHDAQDDFVAKRARCGAFKFCIWWRTKQRIAGLKRFARQR